MRGRSWAVALAALFVVGLAGCGEDAVTQSGAPPGGAAADGRTPSGAYLSIG